MSSSPCCIKVYQLLAQGRWFSPASSTTKTGRHDIAEILLKVALNHKNSNSNSCSSGAHKFTAGLRGLWFLSLSTGAWRFINKIDVGYKKGPVYIYIYIYIWDVTLFVPYIYFIDKTSSSCGLSKLHVFVMMFVSFHNNTTGVTSEAVTAYHTGASELTSVF